MHSLSYAPVARLICYIVYRYLLHLHLSSVCKHRTGSLVKLERNELMSIFGDFGRKLVAAREKQVRRYVNGILLTQDDASLKAAGFDRDELKRNAQAPHPFF